MGKKEIGLVLKILFCKDYTHCLSSETRIVDCLSSASHILCAICWYCICPHHYSCHVFYISPSPILPGGHSSMLWTERLAFSKEGFLFFDCVQHWCRLQSKGRARPHVALDHEATQACGHPCSSALCLCSQKLVSLALGMLCRGNCRTGPGQADTAYVFALGYL